MEKIGLLSKHSTSQLYKKGGGGENNISTKLVSFLIYFTESLPISELFSFLF